MNLPVLGIIVGKAGREVEPLLTALPRRGKVPQAQRKQTHKRSCVFGTTTGKRVSQTVDRVIASLRHKRMLCITSWERGETKESLD